MKNSQHDRGIVGYFAGVKNGTPLRTQSDCLAINLVAVFAVMTHFTGDHFQRLIGLRIFQPTPIRRQTELESLESSLAVP